MDNIEEKTTIDNIEEEEQEKTKKCSQCKEFFKISFFDKVGKNKTRSNCKTCRKQQNKDVYQRKKEKKLLNKDLPQPPLI